MERYVQWKGSLKNIIRAVLTFAWTPLVAFTIIPYQSYGFDRYSINACALVEDALKSQKLMDRKTFQLFFADNERYPYDRVLGQNSEIPPSQRVNANCKKHLFKKFQDEIGEELESIQHIFTQTCTEESLARNLAQYKNPKKREKREKEERSFCEDVRIWIDSDQAVLAAIGRAKSIAARTEAAKKGPPDPWANWQETIKKCDCPNLTPAESQVCEWNRQFLPQNTVL